MINKDQQEALRDRLEDYLTSKGINTKKPFLCLNPAHTEKHPSMSFDKKRNKVHCFSCGEDYSIIDLIMMDYGLDYKGALEKGYNMYGITEGSGAVKKAAPSPRSEKQEEAAPAAEMDYSAYYAECEKRINETTYHRGLSLETLKRFHVGYDPVWRDQRKIAEGKNPPKTPRLIIPTSKSSYLARDTREELSEFEQNFKKYKVGNVKFFNLEALEKTKGEEDYSRPVYIVEGEIDAMSVEEVGGAAVALGSISMVNNFLAYLRERKNKPSKVLIVALDNDEKKEDGSPTDSEKKADELEAGLAEQGLLSYRLRSWGYGKDANEALCKDREAFKSFIAATSRAATEEAFKEAREEYKKNSAGANLQAFMNGIAASAETRPFPTGFQKLDNILDGGLYEGLYVIGAITSLGKTTLVMQMADQLAEKGEDVLIFSLEMARTELMSKSISRLTAQIAKWQNIPMNNAKSARGITNGHKWNNYSETERKLIMKAIDAYSEYASNVYIMEGLGDIGVAQIAETVKKHIALTGKRPIVVVDYLQIVAPYNERYSDKQNTDKCVLELKRLSRDNKIPVIAVSSLNRSNYSSSISAEAFKESGAIEYSSDVLLGLQFKGAGTKDAKGNSTFDSEAAARKNPREIELKILKNRNGAKGAVLEFRYYPVFSLYEEV